MGMEVLLILRQLHVQVLQVIQNYAINLIIKVYGIRYYFG